MGGGDPSALKFFGVKFTSPVKPGDALETQVWEVGPGPAGTTEVTFITKDLTTGKVCISCAMSTSLVIYIYSQVVLGNGIAYVKKSAKSKL